MPRKRGIKMKTLDFGPWKVVDHTTQTESYQSDIADAVIIKDFLIGLNHPVSIIKTQTGEVHPFMPKK